ncbi:MAG: hypothetical protein ACP5H2_05550 [Solirubrobacteraceae bacterium]
MLLWFEDDEHGRRALQRASELTASAGELTVVTVASHESLAGCGRCAVGTVMWNIELQEMADADLLTARAFLHGRENVTYKRLEGATKEIPALLIAAATQAQADLVILPRRFGPRHLPGASRRCVRATIAAAGNWRVESGLAAG